ncbi:hypothetical protein [Leptospira idonii]|uniref:Lipoprotein n=1 Tax=Leptospira idonii TaxID=1193500 RepID=A0A4R9LXY1_9LEPT|nr:hypothetical protein [Leptospira idonii]TGN17291.1 hypothetical protein EHS15_17280 [Leptospira idonii]
MKRKLSLFVVASFMLAGFISCAPGEDRVAVNDAQSQIYAAAKFAADKCGTPIPEPAILVINEPLKRNLDLCTISLTRVGCPFVGFPITCLLIYLEKDPGDIPWYMNFNELSKQQIK